MLMQFQDRIPELKAALPDVFSCTDLQKESETSYAGPCPVCGGDDRFVYKTDTGNCWCRQCHAQAMDVVDFHGWLTGKTIPDLMREYLPDDAGQNEDTRQPTPHDLFSKRGLAGEVIRILTEARGLKVTAHAGKQCVAVPYVSLQGEIKATQYLSIDQEPFPFTAKNGKTANKVFGKGDKPGDECFFLAGPGPDQADKIIITEGVINALTAWQWFPKACCIALGGSTYTRKVKALKPYIRQTAKVIICQDNDDAGKMMVQSIYQVLGNKVHRLVWGPDDEPGLDLNDLLQAGQTERGQAMIQMAPEATQPGNDGPIPLPDDLPPVQLFDYDLLPEMLRPWIQDISERMQCPPDFVAVAALGAIAAVLGRKVGIRPQARTDWTVVPNLWIMVVGRPGVLKSPALEAGLAPLKRLIAEANNTYQAAEEQYKVEALTAKLKQDAAEKTARTMLAKDPEADLSAVLAVGGEPVSPVLKRYQANDCTPASLGELLRQNPNGLLVFRDEVVSLLKSLDRDGQEEGRGFYLTAWNGDSPYTFDRIGRGLNLTIPAICLSVLGGTQPGRLSEYIYHAVKGGSADDGLIQRFGITVWPDIPKKWKNVDRTPDYTAKNQAYEVFDYLDKLTPDDIHAEHDTDINGQPDGIPYLRLDTAALEVFTEWRADLEQKLRSDDLLPALESHFAKYRKLIPSLALIFHLADGGIGPVTETATLRALAWGQYLESHAYRAYGSITSPEISTAKAILKKIQTGKLKPEFGPTDVWRPGWSKLTDRDQVLKGLQVLEDHGWITAEDVPTGGRPKTVYHYNGG
ncbi:DUF3987 domain-containing protein [Desulfobacter postgatei]|jgi:putative DNA primase/helicase|uniref:DUF3987 domain-containing protein n=1 Tax=Desulfobacter postgatei TaxID=2293 RepID=UPI002A359112|nr:DUF3987 domain-containing protein [Desulfobacter postgatei]MDX9965168.1 DUF3987 domain-containing protein [Desulfobacter postgatei]